MAGNRNEADRNIGPCGPVTVVPGAGQLPQACAPGGSRHPVRAGPAQRRAGTLHAFTVNPTAEHAALRSAQSAALMLRFLITSAYFARSACMRAANASGVAT